MEFGCRYIYVDDSRSESSRQNPAIVPEIVQNGVDQSVPPYYDNGCFEEGLKTEATSNESPQASQDDRLPSKSNLYIVQSSIPTNLEKKIPPPKPDRKKSPSVDCQSGLPPETRPLDSKPQQDPCCTNLDKRETPPPIPDRKKKPSMVLRPVTPTFKSKPASSSAGQDASECATVIYDCATSEEVPLRNSEDNGANIGVYEPGSYEDLPKYDLEASGLSQETKHLEGKAPQDLHLPGFTNISPKTPPPIPERKKKLPSTIVGNLQPSGTMSSIELTYDSAYEEVPACQSEPGSLSQDTNRLESKAPQDLHLPGFTNIRQKTPPPIPDRKKKPPTLQQSVTYDYAYAYQEVPKCPLGLGNTLPDGQLYVDFPPADPKDLFQSLPHDQNKSTFVGQPPDVPKGHPGATTLTNNHHYLEILPALPTEIETQRTPPRSPNRPLTPTMAPPPIKLPANCNILLLKIGKMVDYTGHSSPDYTEGNVPCVSEPQTLGSPLLCCRCSAAFSELNRMEEKSWTCVFCATENPVGEGEHLENSAGGGDHLYCQDSHSGNEYTSMEDTMLIFCIDISGSMSVTSEVTEDERYQSNNNNPTVYKSRMEAMQSALCQTLNFLHKQHPWKRVALVTFSDQVKIYGDGTIQPQVLEDSELLDPDYLKSQGENQPVPGPLQETLHLLETKIECLEESGVTALGPAALVSIAMASKRPGSKVIICTDGRANTDLGNLENIAEEYAYQSSRLYYSGLADLALQHSVVVSVVTIEGTDCRLPELGMLADKTGGKVNIVHPFKLASEFQSILEEEINATDVKVKIFLPPSMHFLYEGHTEPVLERTFGSTTRDTVLSTEFEIHSDKIKEVLRYSQLPIQVQLAFTLPDGRGRNRILSQKRPVTNDGAAALESINLMVLQNHSVHISARLAMEGRVNEATTVALDLKQLVDQVMRNEKYEDQAVVYEDWEYAMAPVYEDLQVYVQEKSSKKNGENGQTDVPVVKTFSDEMAKMIFHMKRAKSKVLNKLKPQAE